MKCHNTECLGEAKPGSNYCEKCRPSRTVPENVEAAQVRVAKAEEDKAKLQQEIVKKHGSIGELDKLCQFANLSNKKDKEAVELRKKYHAATKELRLAKSDLDRMRNEQQQKEDRPKPAPCPSCRRKSSAYCDGCSPANGYKEFVNKGSGIADQVEAVIAKGKAPATIELKDARVEGNAIVATAPPELQDALQGTEGSATVIGADSKGGMIIELKGKDPAPEQPAYMQKMEESAKIADANKGENNAPTKQVDLNGEDLKLPLGVKETKKVSRSRIYEITDFKISIKEDDLADFNHWPPFKQRTFVAKKLRYVPEEEDAIYSNDDFDGAVDEMMRILIRAGLILMTERQREAILMQRLAGMI